MAYSRKDNPYLEPDAVPAIAALKKQLQQLTPTDKDVGRTISKLLQDTRASHGDKGHGLQGREITLIAVDEILTEMQPGDPLGITLAEATLSYMPNAGDGEAGRGIRAWIQNTHTQLESAGIPVSHEAWNTHSDSRYAVDGWGAKRED